MAIPEGSAFQTMISGADPTRDLTDPKNLFDLVVSAYRDKTREVEDLRKKATEIPQKTKLAMGVIGGAGALASLFGKGRTTKGVGAALLGVSQGLKLAGGRGEAAQKLAAAEADRKDAQDAMTRLAPSAFGALELERKLGLATRIFGDRETALQALLTGTIKQKPGEVRKKQRESSLGQLEGQRTFAIDTGKQLGKTPEESKAITETLLGLRSGGGKTEMTPDEQVDLEGRKAEARALGEASGKDKALNRGLGLAHSPGAIGNVLIEANKWDDVRWQSAKKEAFDSAKTVFVEKKMLSPSATDEIQALRTMPLNARPLFQAYVKRELMAQGGIGDVNDLLGAVDDPSTAIAMLIDSGVVLPDDVAKELGDRLNQASDNPIGTLALKKAIQAALNNAVFLGAFDPDLDAKVSAIPSPTGPKQ